MSVPQLRMPSGSSNGSARIIKDPRQRLVLLSDLLCRQTPSGGRGVKRKRTEEPGPETSL